MSILFYDHLIVLEGLDRKLKKLVTSNDELQEIWKTVEELIHHRVLGCILDNLPSHHHTEFLEKFHESPADIKILHFLQKKIDKDVEKIIKKEVKLLKKEILADIKKK